MTSEKISLIAAQEFTDNIGTVFCKVCHKPAYTIVREGDNVKIMQGHKTVMTTKAGSKLNIGSLSCPDGHKNKLNIGGNEMTTEKIPGVPNRPAPPDMEAMRKEQAERMKAAQKPGLEAQVKMLDDMIARQQQMMQEQIDRLTKQRDEVKARLAALG
jgi:hypothetical protein